MIAAEAMLIQSLPSVAAVTHDAAEGIFQERQASILVLLIVLLTGRRGCGCEACGASRGHTRSEHAVLSAGSLSKRCAITRIVGKGLIDSEGQPGPKDPPPQTSGRRQQDSK